MNLAKDAPLGEPWSLPLAALDPSDGTLYQRGLLHEYMRRLRQEDPVHWSPTGPTGPYWSITKFNDIVENLLGEISECDTRIAMMIDASSSMVRPFNAPTLRTGTGSQASFFTTVKAAERFVELRTQGKYRDLMALIEFGDQVKAKAVTAGGLNSVPGSKHFGDQAERYATGNLRDVYFYRDQLKGHTEREYKPGQK